MLKRNTFIRILLFAIIFFILLIFIQGMFPLSDDSIAETWASFRNLPENSLDAVYIGSSTTHYFWQPNTAWENYGFTVFPLTMASLRPQSLKYLITEAQKTQADPLFIINLNTFKTTYISGSVAHKVIDYMPFSCNKLAMIREIIPYTSLRGLDALELYFPIIRFHSDWPNLSFVNLISRDPGYMGAIQADGYFEKTMDIHDIYHEYDNILPMTPDQNEILNDLLSFCSQEDLNVLFIVAPQADSETESAQLNEICRVIAEAGFPVLNLLGKADELQLDLAHDFADDHHTNIHGSLKYTPYLCDYLQEYYHFEDKRSQVAYHNWNVAAEKWKKMVSPYILDLELCYSQRDNHMAEPEIKAVSAKDPGVVIEWIPSDGSNLSRVYRSDGQRWICIAEVGENTGTYTDTEVFAGHTYSYTVICGCRDADETVFGNCDYSGIRVDVPE